MNKYTLHPSVIEVLEGVRQGGRPESENLIMAVRSFIKHTPIDFTIVSNGGFRTAKLQKTLYDRGVSKCDGYIKTSMHQKGLAVDLVPWINGRATWDRDHALYLAGAFMAFCSRSRFEGITTGADWNSDGHLKGDSWDPCHMQIKERNR